MDLPKYENSSPWLSGPSVRCGWSPLKSVRTGETQSTIQPVSLH